jgi:TolB-like protein
MRRQRSVKKRVKNAQLALNVVLTGDCMSSGVASFTLQLRGPFRLHAADGRRVDISSRKGQALIAMLATANGSERTRSWLQSQLWGSRGQDQAQSSLRSELSSLRGLLKHDGPPLLNADHARIWMDLSRIEVDARGPNVAGAGEFLEGLDIPGEDGFEDWLREQRARNEAEVQAEPVAQTVQPTAKPEIPKAFSALPALAVLLFENLTGDPDQDFVAEGISEDLIDRLSRLRWLPIIARSSSFAVRETDPKIVGELLGARYLLEGRMRKQAGANMLSASLVDCETGSTLWSNKLALNAHGAPDAFGELLTGLTIALGAKIDQAEQSRAWGKPQTDLNVRELIWRGRWHLNRFTAEDSEKAKAYIAEALQREPSSPEAIIQMAWANLWDLWAQRGSDDEIRAVRQMAQKAIIADYDDARGHMLAGIAEKWLRQPLRAEALLKRAIELNPSLAMAHAQLGGSQYLRDAPDEAIATLKNAIRLSPNDAELFYYRGELAVSYLMAGAFDDALEQADLSLTRRGAYWFSHVVKINALVRSGDLASAEAAVAELKASIPRFGLHYIDWVPFMDSHWNRFLADGMNQAMAEND